MKSKKSIKVIPMEEFFTKEDGVVFWVWRFIGEKHWRFEKTAFIEIPVIEIKTMGDYKKMFNS